jgi:hypothetical protein
MQDKHLNLTNPNRSLAASAAAAAAGEAENDKFSPQPPPQSSLLNFTTFYSLENWRKNARRME